MGNLCSKSANKSGDNFAGPGHRVGGGATGGPSTTAKTTHAVPPSIIATTPGRTLTEGSSNPASNAADPRAAAARAAEERSKPKSGGKLAAELDKRKRQTQNETLALLAKDNTRARDADENQVNREWN